jgi:hypothetical protein
MYEYAIRGPVWKDDVRRRQAVTHHQGSGLDYMARHLDDARRALQAGLRGARALAPDLLDRIADQRTLRLAWDFLAARGGQAPGPNGHRYGDYFSEEVWELCRCLARALRKGTYRPGPERVRWVDKASGRGQRPLVLQNIEDRVVQRAIVSILQPVLDPLFDRHTLGFRPGLGHLHALARAWCLAQLQNRLVWVTEDIKDAFTNVPLPRLYDVLRRLLPDEGLLELLRLVLPGKELRGLRQGGPLSPLMLNVYLNHFLDRPWRQRRGPVPLLRVADDLLVLCRGMREAQKAQVQLRRLLDPAGMHLREEPTETAHDLDLGESVDWLGLEIRWDRGLRFEIANQSWTRLEDLLALSHTKADAPLRASLTVRQWLYQRGPCYPCSDRDAVCERVVELAREQAFDEVPSPSALRQGWRRAHDRWCELRLRVLQEVEAQLLQEIEAGREIG